MSFSPFLFPFILLRSVNTLLESVLRPYKLSLLTLAPKNLKTPYIKIIIHNWIY